jgi:4-aminobutyrate aminotransferase-like enzyme
MLNILEREIVWKYYAFQRVARLMTRGSAFAKTESSGTDLSGKWDQTILNASDVNAYQDATNILAFSTTQSKGNFVQDVDGNTLLDLCSTESMPLGHNSDALLKSVSQKKWDQYVINSAVDAS